MTQTSRHTGGCHCGKVQYEVDVDLGQTLITCNCSICQKTGTILGFVPAANFTLKKGEADLRDYQFGKKSIHHLFCTTCGVRSFARGQMPDGSPMVAVNVRCLEGMDLGTLKTREYDGRSR